MITEACRSYLNGFNELSHWNDQKAIDNVIAVFKVLSYATILPPLIAGAVTLAGRGSKLEDTERLQIFDKVYSGTFFFKLDIDESLRKLNNMKEVADQEGFYQLSDKDNKHAKETIKKLEKIKEDIEKKIFTESLKKDSFEKEIAYANYGIALAKKKLIGNPKHLTKPDRYSADSFKSAYTYFTLAIKGGVEEAQNDKENLQKIETSIGEREKNARERRAEEVKDEHKKAKEAYLRVISSKDKSSPSHSPEDVNEKT